MAATDCSTFLDTTTIPSYLCFPSCVYFTLFPPPDRHASYQERMTINMSWFIQNICMRHPERVRVVSALLGMSAALVPRPPTMCCSLHVTCFLWTICVCYIKVGGWQCASTHPRHACSINTNTNFLEIHVVRVPYLWMAKLLLFHFKTSHVLGKIVRENV